MTLSAFCLFSSIPPASTQIKLRCSAEEYNGLYIIAISVLRIWWNVPDGSARANRSSGPVLAGER